MNERRRVVVILNPASAAGATQKRFERVRHDFERQLDVVGVHLTQAPGHASELAATITKEEADAVVSIGGDGTLNEVLQGLVDDNGNRRDDAPMLGVFPSGTGGDFRRTFGWSSEAADTVARIATGSAREIDVGWLTCVDDQGAPRTRAFLNVSSFGLSGAVDDVVNRSSKALGGKASFFVGTVRAVTGYKVPTVSISVDDGPSVERKISLCVLGNGQYFGGGMWIAPQAVIDDGALEGVSFGDVSLGWWLTRGPKVYAGRHIDLPEVERFACQSLEAKPVSSDPVYIDLDGELPGRLPARWELRPKAVTLLA